MATEGVNGTRINKKGENPRGNKRTTKLGIGCLALLGLLSSCKDNSEIHFDKKFFEYNVTFEGREVVMANIKVYENDDGTYYCVIDFGLFYKNVTISGSEEVVKEGIKNALREKIPDAQLNSEESIANLGYASDAKCDFAFKTYHQYVSDSTLCNDDYTVTYTPTND